MKIKSRFADRVLFECNKNSMKQAVEFALEQGANLSGANLSGADLSGAKITDTVSCDGNFHHITNIGSERGTLELYSCGKDGWYIKRGCFSGSKQEFLASVNKRHGNNEHGRKYRAIIAALLGGAL